MMAWKRAAFQALSERRRLQYLFSVGSLKMKEQISAAHE
jgi:hypothetical protein